MTYLDYIINLIISIFTGVGLLITTESLIIELNILMLILIIINSLIFSYGVYSLVKDFPQIKNKIKSSIKK